MLCPFCHSENGCSLPETQSCWCFSLDVPRELLALVPDQLKGAACICRQCIEHYDRDAESFILSLQNNRA